VFPPLKFRINFANQSTSMSSILATLFTIPAYLEMKLMAQLHGLLIPKTKSIILNYNAAANI